LLANELGDNIEALINKTDPDLNYGIIVQSLDTGEVLYKKYDNRYFKPASTMKVMIAMFALKELGPDYIYTTRLHGNGDLDCSEANNIYLKFSGDPTFTSDDLALLLSELKKQRISEIAGDFVYDSTGYTTPKICGGWM